MGPVVRAGSSEGRDQYRAAGLPACFGGGRDRRTALATIVMPLLGSWHRRTTPERPVRYGIRGRVRDPTGVVHDIASI